MPPRKRRWCGYIEKLPSGSFRAVAYAGTDLLTSRPRYLQETVESYDAATRALVKMQSQINARLHCRRQMCGGQPPAATNMVATDQRR